MDILYLVFEDLNVLMFQYIKMCVIQHVLYYTSSVKKNIFFSQESIINIFFQTDISGN